MVPDNYGGRFGAHFVGPTWRDADFRISFAKTYHRSFTVTSYTEFKASVDEGIKFTWGGNSFWGHDVFWANVVIMFIDFGPLFYLYYWFNKKGKDV